MHPIFRPLIRFAIIFALIYVAVQPYNWYCNLTRKCFPFYFSYYFPTKEGREEINVSFEIQNPRKDLDFSTYNTELNTVTGKKNTTIFHAKNLSNQTIRFRPMMQIEPSDLSDYVTRYECICSNDYELKPNQEIDLRIRFKLNSEIEEAFKANSANDPVRAVKIKFKIK